MKRTFLLFGLFLFTVAAHAEDKRVLSCVKRNGNQRTFLTITQSVNGDYRYKAEQYRHIGCAGEFVDYENEGSIDREVANGQPTAIFSNQHVKTFPFCGKLRSFRDEKFNFGVVFMEGECSLAK